MTTFTVMVKVAGGWHKYGKHKAIERARISARALTLETNIVREKGKL
jgi:hypothetical protein